MMIFSGRKKKLDRKTVSHRITQDSTVRPLEKEGGRYRSSSAAALNLQKERVSLRKGKQTLAQGHRIDAGDRTQALDSWTSVLFG